MEEIFNSGHIIPSEVAASLLSLESERLAAQERQAEIARASRPTEEERRVLLELRQSLFSGGGVRQEVAERIRQIERRKTSRVEEALRAAHAVGSPFGRAHLEPQPPPPPPLDPTFWWAKTGWTTTRGVTAGHFDDGLHFTGGPTSHDGDLQFYSFGAAADFGLSHERIPFSGIGRWRSTPHVELFGGLVGRTGDDDIFTGDLWSKCWMHRTQRIFQLIFGDSGPVERVLGESHETETLIFEENADRTVHTRLRGYQWMPPVEFGGINPSDDLWARIEIRFDIQLEGAGTLLWADPEVLLRTFQWPLTPL